MYWQTLRSTGIFQWWFPPDSDKTSWCSSSGSHQWRRALALLPNYISNHGFCFTFSVRKGLENVQVGMDRSGHSQQPPCCKISYPCCGTVCVHCLVHQGVCRSALSQLTHCTGKQKHQVQSLRCLQAATSSQVPICSRTWPQNRSDLFCLAGSWEAKC